MDTGTVAAVAALAIAIFALVIALAQVLQQYFVTGQLIRLCDSVVYGDMPGQGRRVWQFSQFRFRVIYQIPQISLPDTFWPAILAQSFNGLGEEKRLPLLFKGIDSFSGCSLSRKTLFAPSTSYYHDKDGLQFPPDVIKIK